MFFCKSPTLVEWHPPPHSNQHPLWTKLIADGVMLSNSIEYANWRASPVYPIVCESCWCAECGPAFAVIVRLAENLLWLPPNQDDFPDLWWPVISEPVLMSERTWEWLRQKFPNMPAAESYPLATRRDLATLWMAEMPEVVRTSQLRKLEPLVSTALASDPLDLEAARYAIGQIVNWVEERPKEPVAGKLLRDDEIEINTLFFDGPPTTLWPAFAIGTPVSFTLGDDVVFVCEARSEREALQSPQTAP
jgi:hypothetical protein